jgi:signal transduction histidine kinase
LVIRFWVYAFIFVVTTAIFYVWLDRRMIRPLARVAGRLEQLAAKGAAQTIRQPRVDIEAAYNRLAESQRGLRLEMDLDRLIEGYQRGEGVFAEEMSMRLLRDGAAAIGEAFALRSVVVAVPSSEGEDWERVSAWPETSHPPPLDELPRLLPPAPQRLSSSQTQSAWWVVPLRPEDDLVGVIYLLDGEEPLPVESVRRTQRLLENSLVRCVSFSRRLAEERNRFGINLATSMGHDLTNIIASGKWDLNTIHRALTTGIVQLDSDKGNVFGQAVEGLKNHLQFLQEMVDIYRALGAARKPCYEHGNVGTYLREVCNLFSLSISQRIDLVQDIPADCEGVVEPRLLKMAVFNLLVNAAHAIQVRDDGLVGGCITVRLSREGADILLTVRDDGPGVRDDNGRLLDDREVSRIFRSGYSTKESGGGLGLVWAKSIVEDFHQGTIRARNAPEGGAEIMIRFPCQSPQRTVT